MAIEFTDQDGNRHLWELTIKQAEGIENSYIELFFFDEHGKPVLFNILQDIFINLISFQYVQDPSFAIIKSNIFAEFPPSISHREQNIPQILITKRNPVEDGREISICRNSLNEIGFIKIDFQLFDTFKKKLQNLAIPAPNTNIHQLYRSFLNEINDFPLIKQLPAFDLNKFSEANQYLKKLLISFHNSKPVGFYEKIFSQWGLQFCLNLLNVMHSPRVMTYNVLPLFKSYWQTYQKNFPYFAIPNHKFTLLLCVITEQLSLYFTNLGQKLSPIEILMPGVSLAPTNKGYPHLNNFKLKNVLYSHILSDDGQCLIPIKLFCILGGKFKKITSPYHPLGLDLSENEFLRLAHHSVATYTIYNLQQALLNKDDPYKRLILASKLFQLYVSTSFENGYYGEDFCNVELNLFDNLKVKPYSNFHKFQEANIELLTFQDKKNFLDLITSIDDLHFLTFGLSPECFYEWLNALGVELIYKFPNSWIEFGRLLNHLPIAYFKEGLKFAGEKLSRIDDFINILYKLSPKKMVIMSAYFHERYNYFFKNKAHLSNLFKNNDIRIIKLITVSTAEFIFEALSATECDELLNKLPPGQIALRLLYFKHNIYKEFIDKPENLQDIDNNLLSIDNYCYGKISLETLKESLNALDRVPGLLQDTPALIKFKDYLTNLDNNRATVSRNNFSGLR